MLGCRLIYRSCHAKGNLAAHAASVRRPVMEAAQGLAWTLQGNTNARELLSGVRRDAAPRENRKQENKSPIASVEGGSYCSLITADVP